jgi:hypothetical protein
MFATIAVTLTLVNVAIATAAGLKYLPDLIPAPLALLFTAGGAVFAGFWLGVVGFWLEWWLFAATMSGLGFAGVLHQYRFLMRESRNRKLMQGMGFTQ